MGHRKRRQGSQDINKRTAKSRDYVAEPPPELMGRSGRIIPHEYLVPAEEVPKTKEALLQGISDLRDQQQMYRGRLLEILDEADPVDLIARASLTYLQIDPDTYKESETDRSLAHIEYLVRGVQEGDV